MVHMCGGYSLVIKLMNSETHSCMHSLASFDTCTHTHTHTHTFTHHESKSHFSRGDLTFPLFGIAFLIILATL